MNLNNIKLGHSPLTDTIFLYRHGKDEGLALDRRNAEADVMSVLVTHMMHDAPNGSVKVISLGDKTYTIKVAPGGSMEEKLWVKCEEINRTIKAQHPDVPLTHVGTHHNAVDDAESQARHLIAMLSGEANEP